MTDEVTYDTAAQADVILGKPDPIPEQGAALPQDGQGCHAGASALEKDSSYTQKSRTLAVFPAFSLAKINK